ncbi:MAG: glycosyl hydrolase [Candidatus Bathyarchaeia archaeon]
MALKRVQEAWNQALCNFYYGLSYVGTLVQELSSIKDRKADGVSTNVVEKRVEKIRGKPEFGVCSYLPDLLHYRERVIPLLGELGVKWLRTDFPFSLWQRDKAKFEMVDEIVEEARRREINILPILGTWTIGSPKPPKNREEFLEYIKELVKRYDGKIDAYEFWNEPNCRWFWRSSIGNFGRLLDLSAQRAKSVNPQIKVGMNVAWLCGLTGPWALKFIERMARGGYLRHVDFIGLHGYPGTYEPGGANTWRERIKAVKKLMEDTVGDKELWVTEFGFYAFRNRLFYPHTPQVQIQYLKEAFDAIATTGDVPVAIWYSLHDPLTLSNLNMQKVTYQEYGFGLYTKKLEPKDTETARVIMEITSR